MWDPQQVCNPPLSCSWALATQLGTRPMFLANFLSPKDAPSPHPHQLESVPVNKGSSCSRCTPSPAYPTGIRGSVEGPGPWGLQTYSRSAAIPEMPQATVPVRGRWVPANLWALPPPSTHILLMFSLLFFVSLRLKCSLSF